MERPLPPPLDALPEEAARAFLLHQPQPVLLKPLDLEQLARVAEGMIAGAAGAGAIH